MTSDQLAIYGLAVAYSVLGAVFAANDMAVFSAFFIFIALGLWIGAWLEQQ